MEDIGTKAKVHGHEAKFGQYVSVITALLTVITFGIAISTPPLSGPFCKGSCFEYPYLEIGSRFPRDYYWMYPAIFLSISFMMMMVTVYRTAADNKKLYGLMGLSFALMGSLVLIMNYFIQVSVIQPSLLAKEKDGISILTQFNPHGIFIVLEEIGFTFMVLSMFVLYPIFNKKGGLEKTLMWTVVTGFILTMVSFVVVTMMHGIQREYRYEVIIISIVWLELILFSFCLAGYFKKM